MDFAALLVGLLAGIISGLLGVGGGIILTPYLHYIDNRPWSESIALSLFVIAIQSPVGVWRHARKGAVGWRIAAPLAITGAAGVWLGDLALPHMPVPSLKLLFAGVLGFAAWRLGRRVTGNAPAWIGWPVGAAAGFISRILGIGGGVVTVPALGLAGVATHVAIGTSLVAVFTNAALVSGASLARGLDVAPAIWLAAGALVGSVVGVRAAHALPEQRLRRVVGVALVVVALLVAVDAVRNLL